MGMSAAEKQRKSRARKDADPERRSKYLQSERAGYTQDKKTGTRKLVADMTDREHRQSKKFGKIINENPEGNRKSLRNCRHSSELHHVPLRRHPESKMRLLSRSKKEIICHIFNKTYRQTNNREETNKPAALQSKIAMLEKQLQDEKRKSNKYKKKLQRVEKRSILTLQGQRQENC